VELLRPRAIKNKQKNTPAARLWQECFLFDEIKKIITNVLFSPFREHSLPSCLTFQAAQH
jgi:hypothetical protein